MNQCDNNIVLPLEECLKNVANNYDFGRNNVFFHFINRTHNNAMVL